MGVLASIWRWLVSIGFAGRRPAGVVTASPATIPSAVPVFGARRPLIDKNGALAGFEFRLPSAVAERLTSAANATAAAAHVTALLASMQGSIAAGRTALISLPLSLLARPAVLAAIPPGVWIAVSDAGQPAVQRPRAHEALTALIRAGAKIGGVGRPISGCDFVVLEATAISAPALTENIAAIRAMWGEVQVVATGVSSITDLEYLLEHGVNLATGIVDHATAAEKRNPLSPRLNQICRLIHHVVSDDDFVEITKSLRGDVELSYQLLRHANSAAMGLTHQPESVDHAAMLLGRDGLYRWLTMLLLGGGSGRSTSRALREIALARARLLETLAGYNGASTSGMFTMGLLSLIDVMLQIPMADALDQLPTAPAMREALLEGTGEWREALELVKALECGDLGNAAGLAWSFGGLPGVMADSDEAWRWAAETSRAMH